MYSVSPTLERLLSIAAGFFPALISSTKYSSKLYILFRRGRALRRRRAWPTSLTRFLSDIPSGGCDAEANTASESPSGSSPSDGRLPTPLPTSTFSSLPPLPLLPSVQPASQTVTHPPGRQAGMQTNGQAGGPTTWPPRRPPTFSLKQTTAGPEAEFFFDFTN